MRFGKRKNRNCKKKTRENAKKSRAVLYNVNEEGQDIGRRRGRNRYFSEENKSTLTEKEDGKAKEREMIAQQRVSR